MTSENGKVGPLRAAVVELLALLEPEDLAALEEALSSRNDLIDAMTESARRVVALAAGRGGNAELIDPVGNLLLAAATISLGAHHAGVQQKATNALRKYHTYQEFGALPPELIIRANRLDPDCVPLLGAAHPLRRALLAARPGQEPSVLLSAVAVAVARCFTGDVDRTATALRVLDRGAELAADHQVTAALAEEAKLPIIGNLGFLTQVAGYGVAITELHSGQRFADPRPEMAESLTGLAKQLHRAVVQYDWIRHDEPDSTRVFHDIAEHLAAAAGADPRHLVRKVFQVVSSELRGLRTAAPHQRTSPVDPIDSAGLFDQASGSRGGTGEESAAEADHIAGWTLYGLFAGAGRDETETLTDWLVGRRPVDTQDGLDLLLVRIRQVMILLAKCPAEPAEPPEGLLWREYPRVRATVRTAIAAAIEAGHGDADSAVRVVAHALPPLWRKRAPVINLVARKVGLDLRKGPGRQAQAMLIGAVVTRAPAQVLHPTRIPAPGCCWTCAGGPPSCGRGPRTAGSTRNRWPEQVVCPDRPWGEIGFVENYDSLSELTEYTAAAVSKHLERLRDDERGGWFALLASVKGP